MSVLCDSTIQKLIEDGLIDFDQSDTDFDTVKSQINPNTMDLTLGRFIQWPKENQEPILFGKKYNADAYWDLRTVMPDEGVLLTPGDVFLGCTREYFRVPSKICGQVFTKSSLGRVFINHMMAGVIDSGFEGTITLELRNDGKHNIIIPYGTRVVQIQFLSLDELPERDYSQRKSRYLRQTKPEPAREELGNDS